MTGTDTFLKETHCFKCGSGEIVAGELYGGGDIVFNPGHIKWYKQIIFRQGVVVLDEAKCCLGCGLVWTRLNVIRLKEFVKTRCEDEFAYRLYGLKDGGHSNAAASGCLNCGSKKEIPGKLFTVAKNGSNYLLAFNTKHLKTFKFVTSHVDLGKTSECCADCGFVFSRLDQKKLGRFILKNCKPEYVAQVYSYEDEK